MAEVGPVLVVVAEATRIRHGGAVEAGGLAGVIMSPSTELARSAGVSGLQGHAVT